MMLVCLQAITQSFIPEVINLAGTQASVNEYTMHWSIGEVVTQPIKSGEYILTQGFQQPKLGRITSYQDPQFLGEIHWYPNPATAKLFLSTDSKEVIVVEFDDLQGKVLKRIRFRQQSAIDIPSWPPGPYLMRWTQKGHPIYHAIWIKN